MPQTERLANLGYLALKVESTKGTPVIPNVFAHLYKESLTTEIPFDENEPIVGTKNRVYQMTQGLRNHQGDFEILGEPNTAQHAFNMVLTAGSITGSDPYTHPFTLSTATNPKSYTVDIQKGQIVCRFWGVEGESIEPSFDKNKMHLNVAVSGLGSFIAREIATIDTTTITLKTDYDYAPTKGLVATDTVRLMSADGATTLDTTVSSVDADGITVVLGASAASFAAGDFIFLRAATPSYSVLTPFEWGRTEFRFGTNAAAALTATQTNLEQGSKWQIMHNFEAREGAQRSGSRDPVALVRLQGDAMLSGKRFLDYPTEINRFQKGGAQACVVRHFSGSGHELRITLNSLVAKSLKKPLETGKIIYQEYEYQAVYNTSDSQAFDVKIINGLSS